MVADFVVLDAGWAAYIEQGAVAESSRGTYMKRWGAWERHCADEGVDPWDAPASAFESLWLLRRESDGSLCSISHVEGISGAVAHFYRKKGLTPANKLPENVGKWRDLLRSRRHDPAVAEASADASVVPMMRADAQALLAAPLPRLIPVHKAALLLMLEGFGARAIDTLSDADIAPATEMKDGVAVLGRQVACDHQERVRGVPWDCAACAVRDAVRQLGPGQCFGTRLVERGPELRVRFRHLAGRYKRGPRPDLTAWEAAGLRRAAVLSTAEVRAEGYRWARARAWVGVAWSCGLRMASDADRLERSALTPDAAGRGWSVRLAVTKDDQAGAKSVVRPFGWDAGDGVVAAAIAEYACVRDALVGDAGRFLVGLGTKTHGQPFRTPLKVADKDLALLARLAGVAPVFTSYSTRKGFAAQAHEDGWPADQIQEALRHLHLTTTHTHYLPKSGAKKAVTKLADRLNVDGGER